MRSSSSWMSCHMTGRQARRGGQSDTKIIPKRKLHLGEFVTRFCTTNLAEWQFGFLPPSSKRERVCVWRRRGGFYLFCRQIWSPPGGSAKKRGKARDSSNGPQRRRGGERLNKIDVWLCLRCCAAHSSGKSAWKKRPSRFGGGIYCTDRPNAVSHSL